MLQKYYSPIRGFTLIELMVVIAILSVLAAVAIPNYVSFRNKGFCTQAEADVENITMALADYYSIATHRLLPSVNDLKINTLNNPGITISGDPNTTITITVTDRTGRCPDEYQRAKEGWNPVADCYTKWIR